MSASTGFTITLGKTSKRVNSTSQSFSGTAYTGCFLKENTSINNPVIILNAPLDKYNYMSWGSRYYWVDETISIDWKRIEIHCHLDPLATYKSSIAGTNVYATYSNSANWNKIIDDVRMSPEKEVTPGSPSSTNLFGFTMTPHSGSVIITVLESAPPPDYSSHHGFKIYAMSVSAFKSCLGDLTSYFDNITSVSQTIDDLAQILGSLWGAIGGTGSWRDNLVKAVYVPISISDIASMPGVSGAGQIYFGAIPCSVSCYSVPPGLVVTNTGTLPVNWTGNATTYPFLKNPRFTQFQIICCGGSYSTIDSTLLKDDTQHGTIYIDSSIDVISGNWSAVITEGSASYNTVHLASFSGCCGIDITGMTQIHDSYKMQGWQAGFGTSLKIFSMGLADIENSSTTRIMSGIGGEFLPSNPGNLQSGSIGGSISAMFLGGSSNLGKISICQTAFEPEDISNYTSFCDRYGYPCNKYLSLSGYSGYVKCVNASVSASGATDSEKALINSFLNSGIYIE